MTHDPELEKKAAFYALVGELRESMPPIVPVRAYLRPFSSDSPYRAHTHLVRHNGMPRHFVVSIDSSMAWRSVKDSLIHEWAHCLSWTSEHDTVLAHDPEWGLAMSRIYQEVVDL